MGEDQSLYTTAMNQASPVVYIECISKVLISDNILEAKSTVNFRYLLQTDSFF